MRGHYPDPSRLNTRKGERGWLQRQQEAQARMAESALDGDPESWRSIDAERRAAEQERERLAMADADRRRAANKLLRVTCPCCDTGAVSVERAELVLAALDRVPVDETARLKALCEKDRRTCPVCDEGTVDGEMSERIVVALEKLPADRVPSVERLQILLALGMGVAYHGVFALRPSNGAHHPRRAAPVTDTVMPANETPEAQSDEEAVAALSVEKKVKRFVPPPFLADE